MSEGRRKKPKGLVLTLVVNWLIKPFTMAALGVLFFKYIFAGLVPVDDAQQYIAGMILLGVAPCTAMVFVWSHLTDGDANYTLVQVSVNDIILVFAFAPIAGLLLGVTDLTVPWETLVASVVIFVVLPLAAGMLTNKRLMKTGGAEAVNRLAGKLKPTVAARARASRRKASPCLLPRTYCPYTPTSRTGPRSTQRASTAAIRRREHRPVSNRARSQCQVRLTRARTIHSH